MKFSIPILVLILPLFCFSQTTENRYFERIEVGYGPEDFVLDTFKSKERLLISCASRRDSDGDFKEIVALQISNDSSYILPRKFEPENLHFNPHGIDLKKINNDVKLYIVNHSKNDIDQILIYKVHKNHLKFEAIIENDLFQSLNSVAIYKNGNFYVTNDSGKKGAVFEKLFALRNSNVVYYNIETENSKIVVENLAYANGLAIEQDTLYLSSTQRSDLLKMKAEDNGNLSLVKQFKGVKGMDNITITKNYLLIPAHPKFLQFLKHMKSDSNFSPGEVFLFDKEGSFKRKIFYNDGSIISAPATALFYENYLYIGQVFNDYLVKIPLNLD